VNTVATHYGLDPPFPPSPPVNDPTGIPQIWVPTFIQQALLTYFAQK